MRASMGKLTLSAPIAVAAATGAAAAATARKAREECTFPPCLCIMFRSGFLQGQESFKFGTPSTRGLIRFGMPHDGSTFAAKALRVEGPSPVRLAYRKVSIPLRIAL